MAAQPPREGTRGRSYCRLVAMRLCVAATGAVAPVLAAATPPLEASGLVPGANAALVEVQTGVVAVPAGIGLVSAGGYAANGRLTDTEMFGGAVDVQIAETRGPDAGAGGLAADPLAAWSRRRAALIRTRPAEGGPVSLGLSAALMETRDRSVDPEAGSWVFGTRNSAYGAAATLGLWDGRVRIANEFAWSRPGAGAPAAETGGSARSGQARRHRLDAELVRAGDAFIAGHGLWSMAGRDYLAPRGNAAADRETRGGGITLGWGAATLALTRIAFRNNLEPAPGVLTLRDSTTAAVLTLALDRLRPGGAGNGVPALLAPATLTLRHEDGALRGLPGDSLGSFAAADVTDRTRTHDALTLGWRWPGAATSLTLARTALDADRPGHENDDSVDRALTLTQSLGPEGWTASLSLLLGENDAFADGARTRAERQELTATLATALEDGPALSASFAFRRSALDRMADADTDIDTGWEAVAAADLTPLLAADEADGARLALMFAVKGSDTDPEDSGLRSIDLRAGVQAAFAF